MVAKNSPLLPESHVCVLRMVRLKVRRLC